MTQAPVASRAPYKVLSLFAGIGGFDLGLERTGGFKTVAFCEIDKNAQRVLKKNWPHVPIYSDVQQLTSDKLAEDGVVIDVICGGFPCQDLSNAGRKAGMGEDTRSGLWSEIVRLAGDIRPSYIIVENVAALLSGPVERPGEWFGGVLGDLASLGFDAEWENIPAGALGAPHLRERVWLVAYAERRHGQELGLFREALSAARGEASDGPLHDSDFGVGWPAESRVLREDHGLSGGSHRLKQLGNAVVPQIPELIGRAILASSRTE